VFDIKPYVKDGWLVSSTGQLRWKEGTNKHDGCFTIDSGSTKAVVGFAGGKSCEFDDFIITPENQFSVAYVTAQRKD
jgi:hypothetical protein